MEAKRRQSIEAPSEERTKADELEALILAIAEDARRRSGTYLKDTVVPEGGE